MNQISLVTEDELSEAIGIKLIKYFLPPNIEITCLRKGGFGYIKGKMKSWCSLSKLHPVFIITDLDRGSCPSALINDWLNGCSPTDNLIFRVAVKEIESWLLADTLAIKALVGPNAKLPQNIDELSDPKLYLLQLAKKASRQVRNDLVQTEGSVSSQGLGYNKRLAKMVNEHWCPHRASTKSDSLARAINRLNLITYPA